MIETNNTFAVVGAWRAHQQVLVGVDVQVAGGGDRVALVGVVGGARAASLRVAAEDLLVGQADGEHHALPVPGARARQQQLRVVAGEGGREAGLAVALPMMTPHGYSFKKLITIVTQIF